MTDQHNNNAPAVPLGYVNAGHLHEMQSGRLPYAYLYAAPGVGVEIPVYTSNAPAVPQGWKLVQTPITEEMHVAAAKVLHRAPGLAGLPQRMLDAMLAATPAHAPAVPQGWQFKRNEDGSVGIFAPPPKPGESQRTSHVVYLSQNWDLHEPLGKLADQQAATPALAPAQEVATLSLAAEDVHAAFAKNFPKSRISQAWINFAADIAQAIAARAAKPAQEAGLTEHEVGDCIDKTNRESQYGQWQFGWSKDLAANIIAALRAKGGK